MSYMVTRWLAAMTMVILVLGLPNQTDDKTVRLEVMTTTKIMVLMLEVLIHVAMVMHL